MRTIRALLLLAALAAGFVSAAHAQGTAVPSASLLALVEDTDGSGTTNCGDHIRYTLTLDGADLVALQGAHFEVTIPTNGRLDPASLGISQPVPVQGPVAILSGNQPGDSQISLDLGQVCVTGTCPTTVNGPTVAWTVEIVAPNPFNFLRVQGQLSGANFPSILTDNPALPGTTDPTTVTYEPCAGPPSPSVHVEATLADALAADQDGDGVADPGDRVRYTALLRNTGSITAPSTVFAITPDPFSRLVVGSVSTSFGSVTEGNSSGDTAVRVAVGTLSSAIVTIRYDVTVNASVPAPISQLSTQGSVSGQNFQAVATDDPDQGGTADPTTTPLDFDPDLSLAKSDGGALAAPGQRVAYTLTASNLSARAGASGVVLTDAVPANTTFDAAGSSSGWSCTPNGNPGSTCRLTVGSVAASGSVARTFAVRVVDPIPAGLSQLTNTATVADDGSQGPDPTPANNTATDTTPIDPAAAQVDLILTKTDGGITAQPGETVTYVLTYANRGHRGASGVQITETVPQYSTFAAGPSSASWSCTTPMAGGTCRLALGGLAGLSGNATARFAVTVDAALPPGSLQLANTASIADDGTNGPDANPADNTASDVTPLVAAPDLVVAKTLAGGSEPRPGGLLAWRLDYRNAGNQGSSANQLDETVPASTTFVAASSTPGWDCQPNAQAGSHCRLDIGSLEAGESGNATFAARIDAELPPGVEAVENCAAIRPYDATQTGAGGSSCSLVPVTEAAPDLSITKSDGGQTVALGGLVRYTLAYANLGNQGATGAELHETVPESSTFESASSTAGWTCSVPVAGGTCTLLLGTLDAGATGAVFFAVRAAASVPEGVTQLVNTARIGDDGTNGADTDPSNNQATDTTPIEGGGGGGVPQLVATKTDYLDQDTNADGTANPGEEVAYYVEITNHGDAAALGGVFTSPIDPHTELIPGSVVASGGQVVDGNDPGDRFLEVDVADLPPGGVATVNFTVRISTPFPPGLDHIACQGQVVGANVPLLLTDDPDTPEPSDPTVTPVVDDGTATSLVEVPTLSTWGLIALTVALAGFGLFYMRSRTGGGQ